MVNISQVSNYTNSTVLRAKLVRVIVLFQASPRSPSEGKGGEAWERGYARESPPRDYKEQLLSISSLTLIGLGLAAVPAISRVRTFNCAGIHSLFSILHPCLAIPPTSGIVSHYIDTTDTCSQSISIISILTLLVSPNTTVYCEQKLTVKGASKVFIYWRITSLIMRSTTGYFYFDLP